jgi:NAD(P)-dependent dehydrogenase (short-subunit alcohol dehydrogenase family)
MGSAGELASLRAECEALGSTCLTFQGDVRDGAAVAAAVEATVTRLGGLDVLFNNAGTPASAPTAWRTSSPRPSGRDDRHQPQGRVDGSQGNCQAIP